MKNKKVLLNFIILIGILVLLNLFFFLKYENIITDIESLKAFILGFKIDRLVFIIFVILQVLLSFLPGQIAGFTGGLLYGPLWGVIYSMIGLLIGSILAFLLGQHFGKPFIENITSSEKLKKYNNFIYKNGKLTLFLIFLFPALPDDLICFIAGFSNIKLKNFVLITFLGRLPGFIVLSFIGAEILDYSMRAKFTIGFILIVVSIIFIKYKNFFETNLKKLINKII